MAAGADSPHAVVTIDEQGKVIDLDAAAERAFGVRLSEARARPLADLMVPDRLPVDRGRVDFTVRRADESGARSQAPPPDPPGGDANFGSALQALLARAEEMAQLGSWDWDLETDELRWSANLHRIFGLEPGATTPTVDLVYQHLYAEDRERVELELETARREGHLSPLEYRIVRADGELRHLHTSQAVVEQVLAGPDESSGRCRTSPTGAAPSAPSRLTSPSLGTDAPAWATLGSLNDAVLLSSTRAANVTAANYVIDGGLIKTT
jgi:PAS domain-containing protein